ncbi:MAG: hypothetical protein ACRC2T_00700 [Thermoguttaceae bacterium]
MRTKTIVSISVLFAIFASTAAFGQSGSSQPTMGTELNQTAIQGATADIFTNEALQLDAVSEFPGRESRSSFVGREPYSSQGSRSSSARSRTSTGTSSTSRTGTAGRTTTSRSNVSRNTTNRNTNAMRMNMMGGMGGMGGANSTTIRSLTTLGFENEKDNEKQIGQATTTEANSIRLPKLEEKINKGGLRFTPIIPITVELSGSTATLRGVVKTERDSRLLEQFVLLEPGVLKINNELDCLPDNTAPGSR